MLIKCMVDKKTFEKKPNGDESKGIQFRLVQTEIEIEDLAKLLSKGATFKPALLKGRKSIDWIGQQLFALDFDGGTTIEKELNNCGDLNILPIFGYKTFSYTQYKEKFRLVFCSNIQITNVEIRNKFQKLLIALFPNSDSVTFDPTRLFFGGKELINCDYNNRININNIMVKFKDKLDSILVDSSSTRLINTNTINSSSISMQKPQTPCPSKVSEDFSHINAIKNLDYILMKHLLQINGDKIICTNKQEVYDFINRIDLCDFTNIHSMVNCILTDHQDDTPSAHIYTTDSRTQIYKCFGCEAKYTIISLVEKLAKCKRIKAIEFIKKIYNIELQQTEWQKQQLEIFDTNIELLLSDEFKEIYPQLHSLIRTRKNNIIALNNFAKMNVKDEDFTVEDNPLFFASLTKLMDILGSKDRTKVSQSITLFTLLNLLNKIPHDKLPEETLNKAKHIVAKYNLNKLTNFYSIEQYGVDSLEESNNIAKTLKENNVSLKGISREYLLRTFGIELTNKIYPQYVYENELGTSEQSNEDTNKIANYILESIEKNGYILEKELKVNNITETQWKRSIQEILDGYGLIKITANKAIKEKYNINVSERSYPKIIVKNE